MATQTYEKELTRNDTGETGGHQAGIHIPKFRTDLIAFLPFLNPNQKNPSAWVKMTDDTGVAWRFRYIYYNNRLHDEGGTRDEYRITHMTKFFRAAGATEGKILVIAGSTEKQRFVISIRDDDQARIESVGSPVTVRLKGWRRVH